MTVEDAMTAWWTLVGDITEYRNDERQKAVYKLRTNKAMVGHLVLAGDALAFRMTALPLLQARYSTHTSKGLFLQVAKAVRWVEENLTEAREAVLHQNGVLHLGKAGGPVSPLHAEAVARHQPVVSDIPPVAGNPPVAITFGGPTPTVGPDLTALRAAVDLLKDEMRKVRCVGISITQEDGVEIELERVVLDRVKL